MSALTWHDTRAGQGRALTVPVSLAPTQAARELAPHLRELAAQAALASSTGGHPRLTPQASQHAPVLPVVTIDGYSGSGKSTLAGALAEILSDWQVLHLDDWYPGWDGLEAGGDIARLVAADLRAGRAASYRAWDWDVDAPGPTVPVAPLPTIIEGCGARQADADLAIWIADPGEPERRRRALARDGEIYAPHWQRWATQDMGRLVE